MQEFCETVYTTSDQHKDASAPRMARDKEDLAKLAAKLDQQSPFSDEVALRNIITGINADTNVNFHNLFIVGKDAVTNMEGQAVFSYSHKCTDAVNTLASPRAVTVDKERGIDPALLFQRFIVVSQSEDICLEVMKCELSPYPPSLFELKNLLRKPDKPPLLHAVRSHVNSSNDAILQVIPKTDYYVLDGGSLIHRLKWTGGSTYNSIADAYASFTVDVYGNATVVFDGYDGGPSTKDNAHQSRTRTKVTNKVDISDATKFVGKKDDFLSNGMNKHALIKLISGRLREMGCHTIQAEGDADLDIVKAAVAMSAYKSTTLIGEDTDLLVLLLYHAPANDCKHLYFRSGKGTPKYNITVLKRLPGDDVCSDLLFIHAFSGCDTTSRIFGVGKKSVVQKVIAGDSVLHECSKVFRTPTADPATVETTGCNAMVSLFNGGKSDSLASLRYSFLAKKVATAKTFVTPERLPPTTSATNLHSRRTYLQVMEWLGKNDGM